MICVDPNCPHEEVSDFLEGFGKKSKESLPFVVYFRNPRPLYTATEEQHLRRFSEAMSSTIKTFEKQEEDKISRPDYWKSIAKDATDDYVMECVHEFRGKRGQYDATYEKEYALMTHGGKDDLAILLYLYEQGKLNWRGAVAQQYGSQAVGNGIGFLLNSMYDFYFCVNAIAAADYLTEPSKWGKLTVDSQIRQWWDHDCDFYSFVPGWRDQLGGFGGPESRLIKDWPATMDVLRKTFRFFVVCECLFQRRQKLSGRNYEETTFSAPELAISLCWAVGLGSGRALDYNGGEWKFASLD